MGNFWKAIKSWLSESRLDVELLEAAEKGDTNKVLTLLDQGANVEARKGYDTALMLAALGGHADTVRLLLHRGANINPNLLYDWFSFHCAVLGGSSEIVRLFLEHGADANTKDPEHEITALMYAAENGYIEIVRLLLEYGAEINVYDWMGRTAFMLAEEYPQIVTLLKQKGAKEEPPEDW